MKELIEKLINYRDKCQRLTADPHAEYPLELLEDEVCQIIEVLELNPEGENWETLHNWSMNKIERLCPDISNKGWLVIHLALLCKQCYECGIKSIKP